MNKHLIVGFALIFGLTSCKESHENYDMGSQSEQSETVSSDHDHQHLHQNEEENKSVFQQKADLEEQGYKIFQMVDETSQDTLLMQQYFIAFLKVGPKRDHTREEAEKLQIEHLSHLKRMYDLGFADISGPFGDEGDARGITIYNVPNLEMADSLANSDPSVKAGRLEIEIRPWWAAKGFKLR